MTYRTPFFNKITLVHIRHHVS
ncbi:hypothetical protein BDFB_007886 [Asbolus verrucosus]|uniref:Uncharacterized protein n=1 Tax=Asbolus verrucosus TaxID=1661398 RepID=A0A482VIF9_ASBVE|nr:hypothetical protein BDFB_007886 [Asbolus verrucosus]